MPRILRDFILRTSFTGSKCAYFIATCGDSMGNTPKYLRQLCEQKKFTYMGCAETVMPENYIAVFNAPERKQAVKIIRNADIVIENTADVIKHNGTIPEKKIGAFAKASSGIINTLFYPLVVSAKKFYATDACIGCGKCTEVCPLNNAKPGAYRIRIIHGFHGGTRIRNGIWDEFSYGGEPKAKRITMGIIRGLQNWYCGSFNSILKEDITSV